VLASVGVKYQKLANGLANKQLRRPTSTEATTEIQDPTDLLLSPQLRNMEVINDSDLEEMSAS
jgi:hypothetical protein